MLQIALIIVGVLLLIMGFKGFSKSGITFSKGIVLSGRSGRLTGIACIVAACGMLAVGGWWIYGSYQTWRESVLRRQQEVAGEKNLQRMAEADQYHDRGRSLLAAGRFDEAINDFDRAIRLWQGKYQYYGDRATAKAGKQDYKAALADYNKAVGLSNSDLRLFLYRGHCQRRLGQPAKAKQDYEAALKLSEVDQDVLMNLAWLCATSTDKTVRDGKRALKLIQDARVTAQYPGWEHETIRAAATAETGDFKTAIRLQQQAIDGSPTSEAGWLSDGISQLRNREPIRDRILQIWESE